MAKTYEGPWVLRSLLFVPGHVEGMINKAAGSQADCVVLDLEDAVPIRSKDEARNLIRETLVNGIYKDKTVFVRVNPLETGLTLLDLDAVACRELHGFVYPMAYTPDDIKNFDAQLRLKEMTLGLPVGHFSIIILIEAPLGVINSYQLAKASDRVVGLLFGCEDYLADMQARHSKDDVTLHTPRAQIALAARAAGVEPIDTPYVKVHDLEGLRQFAMRARNLGMAGMLIMTPRQIKIAHDVYTPNAEEIKVVEEIVSAAKNAEQEGVGIVIVNGKFVSPPTLKAAMKVYERKLAIDQML